MIDDSGGLAARPMALFVHRADLTGQSPSPRHEFRHSGPIQAAVPPPAGPDSAETPDLHTEMVNAAPPGPFSTADSHHRSVVMT